MKKRFFAVALATTMTLSSVMVANAETLTGTEWWKGMQVGQDYALTDGTVTLEVKTSADAGAFSVEVYAPTYFMTTGSDGNAWFAENLNAEGSVMTCPFAENGNKDPEKFVPGNTYEVTATVDGANFKVEYYDVTAGKLIYTMSGTSAAKDIPAASEFKVHVMAQVGTFEVSLNPSPEDTENPDLDVNPSPVPNPSPEPEDVTILDKDSDAYKDFVANLKGLEDGAEVVVMEIENSDGELSVEELGLAGAEWVRVYFADGTYKDIKVVDGKIAFDFADGTYAFVAIDAPEDATKPEDETTTKTEETTTTTGGPKTGDSAPIAILAAMATVAGAGVVVARKKRA